MTTDGVCECAHAKQNVIEEVRRGTSESAQLIVCTSAHPNNCQPGVGNLSVRPAVRCDRRSRPLPYFIMKRAANAPVDTTYTKLELVNSPESVQYGCRS